MCTIKQQTEIFSCWYWICAIQKKKNKSAYVKCNAQHTPQQYTPTTNEDLFFDRLIAIARIFSCTFLFCESYLTYIVATQKHHHKNNQKHRHFSANQVGLLFKISAALLDYNILWRLCIYAAIARIECLHFWFILGASFLCVRYVCQFFLLSLHLCNRCELY